MKSWTWQSKFVFGSGIGVADPKQFCVHCKTEETSKHVGIVAYEDSHLREEKYKYGMGEGEDDAGIKLMVAA